jgi:hypothetical protein
MAMGTRLKLAVTKELYAYWNLLRGARSAPERAEIDPGAIRGVLADTFILEIDGPNRYPIRVAGSRTNALFMRELRGSSFLDLWQRTDRKEIAGVLANVADEAVGMLAGASTGLRSAQSVQLEVLLLPLRHRGATHSRVFGVCGPAALPGWIGLLPADPMSLLSLRVLGRADGTHADSPSCGPDKMAENRHFGRLAQPNRHGHLYVVSPSPTQR